MKHARQEDRRGRVLGRSGGEGGGEARGGGAFSKVTKVAIPPGARDSEIQREGYLALCQRDGDWQGH